jgi:hypothetical protein
MVQCDDFPVSEKVALQLAGLQAQVNLGDPKDSKSLESYMDIDSYLPYRVSRSRGEDVWVKTIPFVHYKVCSLLTFKLVLRLLNEREDACVDFSSSP